MKKLVLIFSIIFLTACSNEINSIYGELHSIEEDFIYVECSDLIRKANKNRIQEDIVGYYSCGIKITEETIITTQAGDVLTFDELNVNNMVSVYLEEPVILSADSEWPIVNAKKIKVFENK